jgi:hypothetical protein
LWLACPNQSIISLTCGCALFVGHAGLFHGVGNCAIVQKSTGCLDSLLKIDCEELYLIRALMPDFA